MAQLAFAAVGAVGAGSIFGAGAAGYGWLAGSLLGAWLFAPNTTVEGPRLNDLSVQVSTYGAPLPIGYGTIRVAGNVIWTDGITETRNKRKVGGKGGPSVTQISYTYTASLAIAFAGREADRLIKLYADGKLIHDAASDSSDPDSETLSRNLNFRFYTGSTTQNVDPLIESVEGVGEVPAYRGTCYMVIDTLPLEDFGNRIPNFSATITFNGTANYPNKIYTGTVGGRYNTESIGQDPLRPTLFFVDNIDEIAKINIETNSIEAENVLASPLVTCYPRVDEDGHLWAQRHEDGGTNCMPWQRIDKDSLEWVGYRAGKPSFSLSGWRHIPQFGQIHFIQVPVGTYGKLSKAAIVVSRLLGYKISAFSREITYYDDDTNDIRLAFLGQEPIGFEPTMSVRDRNQVLWIAGKSGGFDARVKGFTMQKFYNDTTENPGTDWGLEAIAYNAPTGTTPKNVDGSYDLTSWLGRIDAVTYNADDHTLIISGRELGDLTNGRILKLDIETGNVTDTLTLDYGLDSYYKTKWQNGPTSGVLLYGNGHMASLVNATTFEIERGSYTWSNWTAPGGARRASIYHNESASVFFGVNKDDTMQRIWLDRYEGSGEALQDVVEDICERCALTIATDVEASGLSGTVQGYPIGRQVTGANALRPLADAFFFKGFPSDWKIKFTHLGGGNVFAITEDDLGAVVGSGSKAPTKLIETFIQEQELPWTLNVVHIDRDRDYNQGTQTVKRINEATESREIFTFELPISMTATEAKQIAEKWLYRLWTEQTGLETNVPYKWLRIDPVDTGTITKGSKVYTCRVVTSRFGANMVVGLELVQEDVETLTSGASGFGGDGTPAQDVFVPGFTELIVMDTTLIRDVDATNGQGPVLYLAAYGYKSAWRGAVAFKSTDGTEYFDIQVLTTAPTWGRLTTALTATPGWGAWDRFRTFTVKMGNGTLSSATENQLLTNFANAALVKSGDNWELLQFADVTDNGDGTYTCETLIRGRRGTNNFQAHEAGDLFILLDEDALRRYVGSNENIGNVQYYKGVSIGSIIEQVPAITETLAANSLKPWSPADVRGARDGSNNLTITWERRTRYSGPMLDGLDTVPLNEESEAYEVDILDANGDVVRTIDGLSSETAAYSAANQTSDGFTPGDPIDVVVYQLSALVGRGFGAEATI